MQFKRSFLSFCTLFLFLDLMAIGCSKPIMKISEPYPPIVKEHKHIILNAGSAGMRNTGIYLKKGQRYSILAKGSIDYCPGKNCRAGHDVRPENGWALIARIGSNQWFNPFSLFSTGCLWTAPYSGNLYLGYRQGTMDKFGDPVHPTYYRNDTGGFSIDVIAWAEDDMVQITDFLAEAKDKDPENKAVNDLFRKAEEYKEVILAREMAEKEIEVTSKEIKELKKEQQKEDQEDKIVSSAEPSMLEDEKPKRIVQLETKLAKLMETLSKLDEMKKQLEAERKKTDQLTEELEAKEEREKELLSRLESRKKFPPILVIASPRDGQKTEAVMVHLSGIAEDDQGLKRLEIFINDKLVITAHDRGIVLADKRLSKRLDFDERIPLQKGSNQIKIRATDSDGLVAERVLRIENIDRHRNIWAAVIGINDYLNVRKLKYAVNDAKAFCDLLLNHLRIPPENLTMLIDKDASLTNLRRTLGTKLKSRAGKDDMVIIYFAGHGATEKDVMSPDGDGLEKYLLPYDAELKDLYSSALPMREVSHIFRRIRSERLIFIADACYSGASGGRTVSFSGTRASISADFLDRLAGGKGTVIMTASAANEVSAEDEKLRHGVFTYYLIEGLKGKADTDNDGLISVDEAYRYVSEQVTRATGQEQHPVKKGDVEGSLILSITH
jgi:caspase domain-containing protein